MSTTRTEPSSCFHWYWVDTIVHLACILLRQLSWDSSSTFTHCKYPSYILHSQSLFLSVFTAGNCFPVPPQSLPYLSGPHPSTGSQISPKFKMGICGGGKSVQRKLVLLGDGACGMFSFIEVIASAGATGAWLT